MPIHRPKRHGYIWTRKEWLAVLYLRDQNLSSESDPRCAQLAKAMGRSVDAIWLQIVALDFLDPNKPDGLAPAQQGREVWAEYEQNPRRTLDKGREAYESFLGISG